MQLCSVCNILTTNAVDDDDNDYNDDDIINFNIQNIDSSLMCHNND